MKTLLILRHAKSSWKDAGLPDHERPLNGRGKQDAPRAGEELRRRDLVPQVIVSSTAKRARQTVEALIEASGFEGELTLEAELYGSGAEAYLEAARRLPQGVQCALLAGHNPDVEELVDLLTGESVRMPTAALAQVELDLERWQDLTGDEQGKLVSLWTPRNQDA